MRERNAPQSGREETNRDCIRRLPDLSYLAPVTWIILIFYNSPLNKLYRTTVVVKIVYGSKIMALLSLKTTAIFERWKFCYWTPCFLRRNCNIICAYSASNQKNDFDLCFIISRVSAEKQHSSTSEKNCSICQGGNCDS